MPKRRYAKVGCALEYEGTPFRRLKGIRMSKSRFTLVSLLALFLWTQSSIAQQRRPILDALFKTLMDAQLEQEKQRQVESQIGWDHRHHRQ